MSLFFFFYLAPIPTFQPTSFYKLQKFELMRKLIFAGYFLLISLVFVACSSDSDDISPKVEENTVELQRILELVNEVRAKGTTCGTTYYPPVGKLTWNSKLEKAALNHSQDMKDNNFFRHTSSNGDNLTDRLKEVDYNYKSAGENIAKGYTSEEAVMQGWLNSQGHCANIMNASYTEMGVGRIDNIWTQNFGSR